MTTTPEPQRAAEGRPDVDDAEALPELANQCSDTPFIGNVRPPVGPWKDSTRIVIIGP